MGYPGRIKTRGERILIKLNWIAGFFLVAMAMIMIIPCVTAEALNPAYYQGKAYPGTTITIRDDTAVCNALGLHPYAPYPNQTYFGNANHDYYWNYGDFQYIVTNNSGNEQYTFKPASAYSYSYLVEAGICDYVLMHDRWWNTTNDSPPPTANFTANPTYGVVPLSILLTDTSTGSPTSWNWSVKALTSGNTYNSSLQNPVFYLPEVSAYNVTLKVFNGGGSSSLTKANYITTTLNPPGGGVSLNLDVRSISNTDLLVTGAQVAIRNITSGVWGNTTAHTGAIQFSDVGGLPLGINQTVTLCASATGYDSVCQNVVIPYNEYLSTIFLTPNNMQTSGGNWNLIVTVKRNLDAQPVFGAHVEVMTGVSGAGIFTGGTGDDGSVSFINISASTSAIVSVVKQGYQSASSVVTVVPNSTQHVTIEIVRIGDTPVATPIAPTAATTLVGGGGDSSVSPEITDANGNVITTSEGKAEWAFDYLFALLPLIVVVVGSLIMMWLFWRGLDIVTNGMASLIMRKFVEGILRGMFK
jgi:PKD repeat protein